MFEAIVPAAPTVTDDDQVLLFKETSKPVGAETDIAACILTPETVNDWEEAEVVEGVFAQAEKAEKEVVEAVITAGGVNL